MSASTRSVATLVAVGLALVGAWPSLVRRSRAPARVDLVVRPVPLDPGDPARTSVGDLRYLGGLWLQSADRRFGGLSDLRLSADGRHLFAVSDCGAGFTATLGYDAAGRLATLTDPEMHALTGPGGRPLAIGEEDAESLVMDANALEVGFEGHARIWAYRLHPAFAGPPRPVPIPPGALACGRNSGLETMTALRDGRRLLVCEGRRQPSSTVPAWIGRGARWTDRTYPLTFEGGWAEEPFRPTGAAPLPGGGALVVERRFPPLGARIVRLSQEDLDGTGPLEPRLVARIEPPLSLDNFEGIETRLDAAGRTIVYLLSDDNNCAKNAGSSGSGLQRTLLMSFVLEE